MENGRYPEPATVLMNTIRIPGPGNGRSEDSNTHEDNGEVARITGSSRQGSIGGSSSRSSLNDSIKDDFDLLWRLRKYLVLLGVLAVSVTYNAGLTPPGGFWTQNKDGHDAGDPVLRDRFSQRYEVFFYCNATAFAASLVLIILLLSKRVTRQKMWLHSMQFTMILDLFSLLGAYAAGSCRALKSSIYIWVLVLAVFVYVGIHILVYIRVFPETLKKELKTMLNGILSKWSIRDWLVSSHLKKEIEEARKFILMLVTFAATITYQAGLNPPGGFWAENEHDRKLPSALRPYRPPATSVLRSNYLRRYNTFVIFNSTSFVASLAIVILLLSPELSRHGIRTKAVMMCVVADLLCLIGAYAAGCCRDVATSFYVLFIIVIVFTSFALLAGIFVYKPVAHWLEKVKSNSLCCMSKLGRILSLNFGSKRSSNAEQENSHASYHQYSGRSKDAPVEDNAPEPEDQSAGSEQVSNGKEAESHEQHPPAHKQQTANIEEAVSNSQHPSGNSQQSANTKDAVSNLEGHNLEDQSTDYQLVANMKEDVSNSQHTSGNNQQSVNTKDVVSNPEYRSTDGRLVADTETESSTEQEHPSVSYQQTANTNYGMYTDNQQVASMKGQSSTDDLKTSVHPVEQSLLVSDSNGATNHDIVEEGLSEETSGNVDYAEQNTLVEDENRDIENGGSSTYTKHFENGHIDSNRGAPDQNAENNRAEKHLKKTRTNLLLLAILAVSLTYQSGLNPPGGFWSGSEDGHSAGDRILEDTHHPRFIAFFYLNAVAFVASIVMIFLLLNKMMSKKVTKRRALPITMIVVLLSLTGAFAMGNCREAKKSIVISVLVCLVFVYAVIHALIAIHIIPGEWKRQVLSVVCQSDHVSTEDGISGKELERRRNLLLMLAILAATVTYQAGLNPPGGVWSDGKGVTGIPSNPGVTGTPGNPVLEDTHRKRYDVFYYSNSVSFVSSVVVTILLVNKESCEHGIKSYALRACLVVGLLGLLIAYVAGSCRNRQQSIYLSIIAVAVLVSLVIQVLLSSMHHTLGRPLAKSVGFLQRYLLPTENVWQQVTSKKPEASDCNEKIVRKRHKYLMLLAILAASIAYQAGLNPPGGFWSDDVGHVAGNPVLHDINHQRYKIFFCFNSFAFMASIVMIMLLLSKSVRKKDVPLGVLRLITRLDLLALMTAFAAGSCRKFRTSVYLYALVAVVVIYLVLIIVLSSGIAKYLRLRKRSGLSFWRLNEHASRTNVTAPGQQA